VVAVEAAIAVTMVVVAEAVAKQKTPMFPSGFFNVM